MSPWFCEGWIVIVKNYRSNLIRHWKETLNSRPCLSLNHWTYRCKKENPETQLKIIIQIREPFVDVHWSFSANLPMKASVNTFCYSTLTFVIMQMFKTARKQLSIFSLLSRRRKEDGQRGRKDGKRFVIPMHLRLPLLVMWGFWMNRERKWRQGTLTLPFLKSQNYWVLSGVSCP